MNYKSSRWQRKRKVILDRDRRRERRRVGLAKVSVWPRNTARSPP